MSSDPRVWTGIRRAAGLLRRAIEVVRAMLGVPDYERYLDHLRVHHPGEAPLSATEFARRRLEARYNTPGSRCC